MKLSEVEIAAELVAHPGWKQKGEAIVKTYALRSFPEAIAFVTRLAFDAEASDHHPDLQISYKNVTVSWSTHSAGGITEKDLAGAKQTDIVAERFR
jgi:4a-hydroxytetrahydrobiopterin dehydratase